MESPTVEKRSRRQLGCLLLVFFVSALVTLLIASLAKAGEGGTWGATELQLQNPDSFPRFARITFRSPQGNLATTFTDTLLPLHGSVYSPTFPTPFTGTVRVDSAGPLLGVVTHFGLPDDPVGAAQWPLVDDADVGTVAFVPRFEAQVNGPSSRLVVHNLDDTAANTQLAFYDPLGALVFTRTAAIPPLGSVLLDRVSLNLPPTFKASVVITADRRIYVAAQRIVNEAFGATQAFARGGLKLDAPLFMAQYNGLNSVIVVQNIAH